MTWTHNLNYFSARFCHFMFYFVFGLIIKNLVTCKVSLVEGVCEMSGAVLYCFCYYRFVDRDIHCQLKRTENLLCRCSFRVTFNRMWLSQYGVLLCDLHQWLDKNKWKWQQILKLKAFKAVIWILWRERMSLVIRISAVQVPFHTENHTEGQAHRDLYVQWHLLQSINQ